ncbi:unnamed protein product [Cuscuta epithymum]|uniref:NAC domain-containing protein n=1 Tax=Cuscuta epithymum TaxID=186058 RepID=A0AAV0CCI1_9ASTE|nr:unnamed protein product [Cuscuta epithymum]
MMASGGATVALPPGFRFHPTDEELVAYYLKRKINGRFIELDVIPEVDLYKCEPWELPGKALLASKDLEWYFFSPRDRKYPNGSRTNRATKAGYWKATGKDRKVNSEMRAVGMKKTLVYHRGRAPHGARTDWIMHEYRLEERECETRSGLQDAYALCRVLKRNITGSEIGENYPVSAAGSEGQTSSSAYAMATPSSSMSVSHDGSGIGYPAPFQDLFAQPPLEVTDFTQSGYLQSQMPQPSYVSEEVNHRTVGAHDCINQINASDYTDEFAFFPQNERFQNNGSSGYVMEEWRGDDNNQNIEEFGDEEFNWDRMGENIRWVDMLDQESVRR